MKRSKPGLTVIDAGPDLFITKDQLVRANRESIRLGSSWNLTEAIETLPHRRFRLAKVLRHVSSKGAETIRLLVMIGSRLNGSDLCPHLLDVTPDAYQEIKKNQFPGEGGPPEADRGVGKSGPVPG